MVKKINKIITIIITIGVAMGIFGCSKRNEGQKSDNQIRKEKTEAFLKTKGVPINPSLPLVESENEARIRSPKEVAKRTIILYCIAGLPHGLDREKTIEWLKKEDLWDDVTPQEKKYNFSDKPTEQAKIDSSWRIEAVWVLLWTLGKIDTLDFPIKMCDVDKVQTLLPEPGTSTKEFIKNASLKTKKEILDETDMIYRIHWAVRDAQFNDKEFPANLNSGVITERHYVLNWLTLYADEWDDITTDT